MLDLESPALPPSPYSGRTLQQRLPLGNRMMPSFRKSVERYIHAIGRSRNVPNPEPKALDLADEIDMRLRTAPDYYPHGAKWLLERCAAMLRAKATTEEKPA